MFKDRIINILQGIFPFDYATYVILLLNSFVLFLDGFQLHPSTDRNDNKGD